MNVDELPLRINCPGISSENVQGPIMQFVGFSSREHERWMVQVPLMHKPTLPAEFVRVPEDIGEPAVVLYERCERHEAAASQIAPGPWPTPAQASVEHRAFVALSQPPISFESVLAKFRDLDKKITEHLQTLSPAERTQFLLEHNLKLPVAAELEPENLHDWSI